MNKDTLTVIEADRMLYLAYVDVISLLGLDTFTRLNNKARLMTQREFFTHIAEMIRSVPAQMRALENEISADYQKQIAELKKEIEGLKGKSTQETPRVPKVGDTVWIFHLSKRFWIETKVVEIKPGNGCYDFGSKENSGRKYYRNFDEMGTFWAWEKPQPETLKLPKVGDEVWTADLNGSPQALYITNHPWWKGKVVSVTSEGFWLDGACYLRKFSDHGVYWAWENPQETPKAEDKTEKQPDPGSGYRLLEKGEIIQSSDEYWSPLSSYWHLTYCPGEPVGGIKTTYTYRRKVEEKKPDPGSGYRLLEKGEILEKSDERWSVIFNEWRPTNYPGEPVGGKNTGECTYRREIVKTQNGISCGNGYRLLDKNEILKADDEYRSSMDQKWGQTSFPGAPVGIGGNYVYRRKI